jgi:hypothetical protein
MIRWASNSGGSVLEAPAMIVGIIRPAWFALVMTDSHLGFEVMSDPLWLSTDNGTVQPMISFVAFGLRGGLSSGQVEANNNSIASGQALVA